MKAYSILLWTIILSAACNPSAKLTGNKGKPPIPQSITDIDGQIKLLGEGRKADLTKSQFNDWFQHGYETYTADGLTLNQLRKPFETIQTTIFMGTWCGDSRREVPRVIKILDSLGIDPISTRIVFVNNTENAYKLSPGHEERGAHIFRVPTIVFKRSGREIGRIIESPVSSLETDMSRIANGDSYLPNYNAADRLMKSLESQSSSALIADSSKWLRELKPLLQHYRDLNSIAGVLLAEKQTEKAITILEWNEKLFPAEAGIKEKLRQVKAMLQP